MRPRLFSAVALATILGITGCTTTPSVSRDPLAASRSTLKLAEFRHSPALSLDVAHQMLAIAIDPAQPTPIRNEATLLYNRAVAECSATLETKVQRVSFGSHGTRYLVTFTPPPLTDRLIISGDIRRKHMKQDVRRTGFGGTLVGVENGPETASPNRPPRGYALPWTAIAEFGPQKNTTVPVSIRFYDPREIESIPLAGQPRALAGDFTAPLAYYPAQNELLFGLTAMLRSDLSIKKSALLIYEPYASDKIPIFFVHGLMSSPHAWLQFVNELYADPDFRKNYRIGTFFYPTGAPIAANALSFRQALTTYTSAHSPKHKIVIVGHSMGGILTRMQVTNSDRKVWDAIFRDRADKIYAQVPADSILKQALIWKANPHVARVIFFATPHLGSRLANLHAAGLAASLIRMPKKLVTDFNDQIADVLQLADPSFRHLPTSIRGLSPDNRLLQTVGKLPMTVPCNSIIGNRGRDRTPLADSSDGVVPYWSSHLAQAESELIVPTGHDAFNSPQSVHEFERILAQDRR